MIAAGLLLFGLTSKVSLAVDSGPSPDDRLEPFQALVLTQGTQFERQEWKPADDERLTLYAFVQATEWSRPMARLLRELDTTLTDLPGQPPMRAVWLTADADEAKEYLPRGRDAIQLRSATYAVFADPSGPNNWGINPDATLTLVVARGGKVIKSFAYVSVNETDAPAVREVLKQAAK